ncbi:hypothetical protein [Embleya sp. NPDC050493]|uniref:hypothetical protein n=1 Tax=Embleya sp. NPDC050493 TaxID=3363989 RepID=UPI00378C5B49
MVAFAYEERRAVESYRRRVEGLHAQLDRDAGFFDGMPLRVSAHEWRAPSAWKESEVFSVIGIGLSGNLDRVRTSAETHAEWLAAGHAYVEAIDAAIVAAIPVRAQVLADLDKPTTRVLRRRRRAALRTWEQALETYRTAVAAAEAAYRPTREAVAEAVGATRANDERTEAARRAADEERRHRARASAERPMWGLVLVGEQADPPVTADDPAAAGADSGSGADSGPAAGDVLVYRYDVAPDHPLPAAARPHARTADEPLTAHALEAALRELRDEGVSVTWESAARAALEQECDLVLSSWWDCLFPRSDLFRPPPTRPDATRHTGTSHHSSYGAGGHGCGGSF